MKKALETIKTILVWLVVAAAIGMMIFTIFSVKTFDQNHRSLFGYKLFIVRSDSMSATDFAAGDLILVREVDPATLQVGDIVAYVSRSASNYGDTVTHKIRALTTDENGSPAFITYGTTTGTDDDSPVAYGDILGQYEGRLPGVGSFFTFLRSTTGYFVCVLTPFALLILYNLYVCIRLFRRYKREQEELYCAEESRLEAERIQAEEMQRELEQLRAQLASGGIDDFLTDALLASEPEEEL